MNKKVLVAVDGSEYSKRAFEYALDEANKLDNKLTILKVVPSFGYAGQVLEEALKPEIEEAENLTQELKQKAEEKGVEAEAEVITETNAATGIVKYAKKENQDFIVVGSRGKTDLETIRLGSVSEAIVKRAHCPVLVIR